MSAATMQPQIVEWLNELYEGTEVRDDYIFVPSFGSTALFVYVDEWFEGERVRVLIQAPILMDVPITSELIYYIGVRSGDFAFGHLALLNDDRDSSMGTLVFEYMLLGDTLDKVELEAATAVVAVTADSLDDGLQSRFGGGVFDPA